MTWGLAHAQLVGTAAAEGELARRQARAFDRQLEVGYRAVDSVVLGAGRVGVDPADEVLLRGRDAAVDDDVLAWQEEAADRGSLLDPGRANRAEAAEAVPLAVEDEHPGGNPGADAGAEANAGGAGVEVGVGRIGEAGALEPDPALSVLAAPVVADHPRPAAQLDRLVVDDEAALEARV